MHEIGTELGAGSDLCHLGMGTGDRSTCDTGLSIAVNRSETGPLSMRFGFLCTLEA